MFVAALGGCGVPHAGATHVLVTAVIVAGRGRSPFLVLLALIATAFDALLDAMSSDVGRHLLIAAQHLLPLSCEG
jgi:hypothetical protein